MKKSTKPIILVLLFMMFGVCSYAQTITSASISGTVYNEKNEVLPGANITAIHVPSGTKYVISTLENGQFTLPSVRTGGPYTVTISFVGYENTVINDIYLNLGQDLELTPSLTLTSGKIEEVVISGKQDPIFNVDHNGAGTNISTSEISGIPTLTRSINDMTKLTPQSYYGTSYSNFVGRNDLYNNLTINGALFNNVFGLAAQIGGQTNSQPISLDAMEQIQISLSPYDVRQGGFSGANINAVTRSGTNEFSGSVYRYWKNQNYLGTTIQGTGVTNSSFNYYQNGFRLGGPILKNKLFFFLSAEMEQNEQPLSNYVASTPSNPTGANVTNIPADTLNALSQFLISKFGYNPGSYQNITATTYSQKLLIRLDYNISQNHKLNISFNSLKSWRNNIPPSGQSDGPTELYFSNNTYEINNNMNSVVAELNSTFGNRMSNNLIIGYTALRDYRESPSAIFPMVQIYNNGVLMTSFGMEQYTPNNLLNTNEFQASDNFTMHFGPHTVTLGGSYEGYGFKNGFTPDFDGIYVYNSLDNFYTDANSNGALHAVPLKKYEYEYSAQPGVTVPYAYLNVSQIGFYLQDEWKMNKQLKISYGLRCDVPYYPVTLQRNPEVAADQFIDQNGNPATIGVNHLPKAVVMYSPRIGFNWDVFNDKKTQVRGGAGIFTGRIPFVWISNQASNNGIIFGQLLQNSVTAAKNLYPFSPKVNEYQPASATYPPSFAINATDPSFKWPQTFRSNLAIDQKLPWGIVGTLEGIFSNTLNDVYMNDWNLRNPTGFRGDGRPVYPSPYKINPAITNAFVLINTNLGYSYFITPQLTKSIQFGTQSLDAMIAYTYSETYDASSANASTASSLFAGHPTGGNDNRPRLAYSDNDQPQKLVGYIKYRIEYAHNFASALSIVYTGVENGRFSYTYNGDYNGDGQTYNDLIYIPRNQSEINLVAAGGTDPRTAAQTWNDLNNYINQDAYLSKHRGQIMERNGAIYPWRSQFDLKFIQDAFINVGGKRNTLEFSLDMLNFGNCLNSNWGVSKVVNNSEFLTVVPGGTVDSHGNPEVTFPLFVNNATTKTPLTSTFSTNYGISSLWQLQLGIRYIFN